MEVHNSQMAPSQNQPTYEKRWTQFFLVLSLITWCVVETFCWLGLRILSADGFDQVFYYDYESRLRNIPQQSIDRFRKFSFDPLLGWDVTKGMTHTSENRARQKWTENVEKTGERRNPFQSSRVLISTFGDSFTYGYEVNDDETWPYFLSVLSGTKVLNYGSGGHGPDQTFLKLQRNIESGVKTPIVIFSIWTGSLNRLLTSYRPFYESRVPGNLEFKPMLVNEGSGLRWRKSPLQKIRNQQDALAALQEAKKYDLWYRLRTVKKSFPFSINLMKLAFAVFQGRHTIYEKPCDNDEVKSRVSFLLSNLRSHSRKFGYTPVVLFIPMGSELRTRMNGGKCDCSSFIQEMQEFSQAKDMIFVDVCRKKFDERKFFIQQFEGHASPYGNQMIAQAVFEKVRLR